MLSNTTPPWIIPGEPGQSGSCMRGRIFPEGFWLYREEKEAAVEIEGPAAPGCQGSTQTTPNYPMALLNSPSHSVKLSLVQKTKGNSLSEVWKIWFHQINDPRSTSAIGVSQWRRESHTQVFALCIKSLAIHSHKCHSITQSRTGFLAQINPNLCFKLSETKIAC